MPPKINRKNKYLKNKDKQEQMRTFKEMKINSQFASTSKVLDFEMDKKQEQKFHVKFPFPISIPLVVSPEQKRNFIMADIKAQHNMIENLKQDLNHSLRELKLCDKIIKSETDGQKLSVSEKMQYFQIVEDIKNDSKFLETIKKCELLNDEKFFRKICKFLRVENCFDQKLKDPILKYSLEKWNATINEFIAHDCLCKIDELKAIVLGTNGTDEFNICTAFVEDEQFDNSLFELPSFIQNFIIYLNSINSKFDCTSNEEKDYDFKAMRAKKEGYLFLNTSLSINANGIVNSICTVEFVNRVLLKAKQASRKVAVLDMRQLTKNYDEVDQFIKVDDCDNWHRVVKLNHPIYWDDDEDFDPNDNEEIRQLKSLIQDGYDINCIYMSESKYNEFLEKKIEKSKADFDENPQDGSNSCEQSPSSNDDITNSSNLSGNNNDSNLNNNNNNDDNFGGESKNKKSNEDENLDYSKEEIKNEFTKGDHIQIEDILRVLLTLALKENWKVNSLDVNQACLDSWNNEVYYEKFSTDDCDVYKGQFPIGHEITTVFILLDLKSNKALSFNSNYEKYNFDFLGIKIFRPPKMNCFVLDQIDAINEIIQNENNVEKVEWMKQKLDDVSRKTRPDIFSTVKLLNSSELDSSQTQQALSNIITYLKRTNEYKFYLDPVEATCAYSDGSNKNLNPEFKKATNQNCAIEKLIDQTDCLKLKNTDEVEKTFKITDLNRFQTGYIIEIFRCFFVWNSINEKTGLTSVNLELVGKLRVVEKVDKFRKLFDFIGVISFNSITVYLDFRDAQKKGLNAVKQRIKELTAFTKGTNIIKFPYITSSNNIADKFTKPFHIRNNEINKDFLNFLGLRLKM